MDTQTILGIVVALLLVALIGAMFYIQRLQAKISRLEIDSSSPGVATQSQQGNKQLQLAACERLTLFAERTRINNLISRLFQSQYSARDMQQAITGSIREEYEYNLSQQLYISPEVWDAVTKLKEQNIYIVNQITASLPPNATGLDLNKHLLEFTVQNPNATMNNVVLEALQFEARRIMV
jgi:hypothetical protein